MTCKSWKGNPDYDTEFNRNRYGIGDHNYCRNPDETNGMWCYTTENRPSDGKGWDYCDKNDGKTVPYCDTHLTYVIKKDLEVFMDLYGLTHEDLDTVPDRDVIDNLEADKTLKTAFNMYLNLIGEPKEEDIMFENMLLTAPGDSILQVVAGLLKGAHNLNLKQNLKSEAMEKGRRPTKYRIIWEFLK